jgi:hypothetical protein
MITGSDGHKLFCCNKSLTIEAKRWGKRAWYQNPGRTLKLIIFKMKKLQSLGRILSKDEQKRIMGGDSEYDELEDEYGCGTGISCSGKSSGDTCGTKSCVCEKHPNGGDKLYCTTQI